MMGFEMIASFSVKLKLQGTQVLFSRTGSSLNEWIYPHSDVQG